MDHENSLVVKRFENRNGVISWRVTGWLHGVRIRKNFKSREEAAAEKGEGRAGGARGAEKKAIRVAGRFSTPHGF